MPTPKPKPSAKEKALASVAQAPIGAQIRSLAQAGLDDSEQLEFYRCDDWFDSEESDYSNPFVIIKAKHSKLKNKLILTLAENDINGKRSMVSLPFDDMRARYVAYFNTNTIPLGPCVFKRIDSGKGNPYIAIADAKEAGSVDSNNDDELPF